MSANKIGRNKKWCEHYKSIGQRESNKALKQKRAEKRVEKFAKRREEGKAYEYKPLSLDKDASKADKKKYWNERRAREAKNVDHRDPISKRKSIMRKIQNKLDLEKAQDKKRKEAMVNG